MGRSDAGLRDLDHYRSRLPYWRYRVRRWLISLMRWETPFLARCQAAVRHPALDSYFAITANLGTHTFFMVGLPVLFWCGYTSLGRAMVHVLAAGVFFSGFVKDMVCLPRPLSPPLHRISMSHSAALEYGFPSTHSTNAMSVVTYVLLMLHDPANSFSLKAKITMEAMAFVYASTIILGRLYCGMHGFFDVGFGGVLGVAMSFVHYAYVASWDTFIWEGDLQAIFIFILVIMVLVRIHPEPADDCPCFDDGVAFAGVVLGIDIGWWHFASTKYSDNEPVPGTTPFSFEAFGLPKVLARIIFGVGVIFVWRAVMKSLLLKFLPYVFRISERLGLNLPRKFFKQASEYDKVQQPIQDDNVMPSVTALPDFISSIRHPARSRAVSIGPQSAADAYETLAFRQKRRRESRSASHSLSEAEARLVRESENSEKPEVLRPTRTQPSPHHLLPTPKPSDPDLAAKATGGAVVDSPLTPSDSKQSLQIASRTPSQDRREDEKDEREIFSKLEKPRVRYDVEVVTKMVVYCGIGFWAIEGNPILFQLIGLG